MTETPVTPHGLDEHELQLLEASTRDHRRLHVHVNGCAFSCCGRGWRRRDGYPQDYCGYIDNLKPPEGNAHGTFMLYSDGVGALTYVIAVRFYEVELVEEAP
jgi:hypothetical protein